MRGNILNIFRKYCYSNIYIKPHPNRGLVKEALLSQKGKLTVTIFFPLILFLCFGISNAQEKPIDTLPVEITSFTYWMNGDNVVLYWTTATRINCFGFSVERKDTLTDWTEIGFVMAPGDSYIPESFSYTDESPLPGLYKYRLKQIDMDGSFSHYHVILEVLIIPPNVVSDYKDYLPKAPILFQNYPNPFNPTTVISYQLSTVSNISLKIYDMLGRVVTTLVDELKSPGVYKVQWDASGFPSGTYFAILITSDFLITKKIVLQK